MIILCFSLGLPKKCRRKIVQHFPNIEHWLETEDERRIRLESENIAARERQQEEERKENERLRVINEANNQNNTNANNNNSAFNNSEEDRLRNLNIEGIRIEFHPDADGVMWPSRRLVFSDPSQPRINHLNDSNFIDLRDFNEDTARRQLLRLLFVQNFLNPEMSMLARQNILNSGNSSMSTTQVNSKFNRIISHEFSRMKLN